MTEIHERIKLIKDIMKIHEDASQTRMRGYVSSEGVMSGMLEMLAAVEELVDKLMCDEDARAVDDDLETYISSKDLKDKLAKLKEALG